MIRPRGSVQLIEGATLAIIVGVLPSTALIGTLISGGGLSVPGVATGLSLIAGAILLGAGWATRGVKVVGPLIRESGPFTRRRRWASEAVTKVETLSGDVGWVSIPTAVVVLQLTSGESVRLYQLQSYAWGRRGYERAEAAEAALRAALKNEASSGR